MPTLRRAVFDTNVLISAYLWPGIPRTALDMIRSGRSMLVSAQPAIEEYVRVLGYRKFGLSPEEIAPLVDDLTSLSTIVYPRHTVDVVTRDPTDNLFLEIALQGKCTVLVSGDRHLLDLRRYRRIRILTPAEFVRSFREIEGA
jgi:putative PIN family toxin of toxin-antitoxin system